MTNGDTVTPQELEIRGLRIQNAQLESDLEGKEELLGEYEAECKSREEHAGELYEENKQLREKLESAEDTLNTANERAERLAVQVEKTDAECVRAVGLYEQLQTQLRELRSEHEGKMDGAHFAITALQTQVRELEKEAKPPEGLGIIVVQLSGDRYFWVIANKKEQLARSRNVDTKAVIEEAADAIAAQLRLPVWVDERG